MAKKQAPYLECLKKRGGSKKEGSKKEGSRRLQRMRKAKGCFREFCAEHRGSGLDAIKLHEKFKRTDNATKECIRRKWKGKLKLTKYQLFCQKARGQGLSGKQLLQAYNAQPGIKPRSEMKKKQPSIPIKKKHPSIASFRNKYKTLADLKTSNATGYRNIYLDKRAKYAHAAYSYNIRINMKDMRSKGFATAELAAKALIKFMEKPHAASSTTRKRRRVSSESKRARTKGSTSMVTGLSGRRGKHVK